MVRKDKVIVKIIKRKVMKKGYFISSITINLL